MTQREVAECQAVSERLYAKRYKLLMDEFLTNKDVDLRYQIKLALPDELSSFPIENRELAEAYFQELTRDFVPDNYPDLQLKKRLGVFGNNRLVRFFIERKNRRNEKRGLITLKNK